MEAKEIFSRIKKSQNIENDKELAELLDVKYHTLRSWYQRNSIQAETIIEFSVKNNIDLNYVFGVENCSSETDIPEQSIYFLKQALTVSSVNEVNEILKNITIDNLLKKLFPTTQNNSFFEQLKAIALPQQRIIHFLYVVLKDICNVEDNKSVKESKQYLIEKIENFKLLSFNNLFNYVFTEIDRQKLIKAIERLTEDEINMILMDANKSLDMLNEYLSILNKLTYK